MSNDEPMIGHWRKPRPTQIVLASFGAGKTYSAASRPPQKSTPQTKEDHE